MNFFKKELHSKICVTTVKLPILNCQEYHLLTACFVNHYRNHFDTRNVKKQLFMYFRLAMVGQMPEKFKTFAQASPHYIWG